MRFHKGPDTNNTRRDSNHERYGEELPSGHLTAETLSVRLLSVTCLWHDNRTASAATSRDDGDSSGWHAMLVYFKRLPQRSQTEQPSRAKISRRQELVHCCCVHTRTPCTHIKCTPTNVHKQNVHEPTYVILTNVHKLMCTLFYKQIYTLMCKN